MSKSQRDALESEGSGECFKPNPDKLHIAEDDPKHPNHHAHMLRVNADDVDNLAMYESMLLNGWVRGSVIAIYADGGRYVVAEGRRRLTVLRRVNVERKRQRLPILRPLAVITDDPAKTEAAMNANRKDDPPLVKARRYVELREEIGATQAAALLAMRLDYANALAVCLTLPADIRAKVNIGELPPDVAARQAKNGGSAAVAKVVDAAKGEGGKVDPVRARAAAKDMPKRPKARSSSILASVEDEVRRAYVVCDVPEDVTVARVKAACDVLAWARGGEAPPWLAKYVDSAKAAAKSNGDDGAADVAKAAE